MQPTMLELFRINISNAVHLNLPVLTGELII